MNTVRWYADPRNRLWVTTNWPGWLRQINNHTGRPRYARWPVGLVERSYGPLTDVTP